MNREDVLAALTRHYATGGYAPRAGFTKRPGLWHCACGAEGPVENGQRVSALHREHLADVLVGVAE